MQARTDPRLFDRSRIVSQQRFETPPDT